MPEHDVVRRWSRRIVHPRLTLATTDPAAATAAVCDELSARRFGTRGNDGPTVRMRRRPWFGWLATAASSPCTVTVTPTAETVVVDVEQRGDWPAPERVAEALTAAVARLRAEGQRVTWGEWEAVG